MSWRTSFRQASFRGVPFKVEDYELSGGRRKTVHEYPRRDKPYVEDIGRKAREYPVSGFVIGSDYKTARDALQDALEAEGPGELVHPFYGTLTVDVTTYRVRGSMREGGMARFDIVFVESGALSFPATSVSTGDKLTSAASTVLNVLNAVFSGRYSISNLPNWARQAAGDDLSTVFESVQTLIEQADSSGSWLSVFTEKSGDASASIDDASTLADDIQSALTPTDNVLETAQGASSGLSSVQYWSVSGDASLESDSSSSLGADAAQTEINAVALRELTRGTLIAHGCLLVADIDVAVYDDAIDVRDAFLAAIDLEILATDSDDACVAWGDMRAALYEDLTYRARKASRLLTYTPKCTIPAIVLAYDLYEETDRDDEIVTRNAIAHPCFVPPDALLVLSS